MKKEVKSIHSESECDNCQKKSTTEEGWIEIDIVSEKGIRVIEYKKAGLKFLTRPYVRWKQAMCFCSYECLSSFLQKDKILFIDEILDLRANRDSGV